MRFWGWQAKAPLGTEHVTLLERIVQNETHLDANMINGIPSHTVLIRHSLFKNKTLLLFRVNTLLLPEARHWSCSRNRHWSCSQARPFCPSQTQDTVFVPEKMVLSRLRDHDCRDCRDSRLPCFHDHHRRQPIHDSRPRLVSELNHFPSCLERTRGWPARVGGALGCGAEL